MAVIPRRHHPGPDLGGRARGDLGGIGPVAAGYSGTGADSGRHLWRGTVFVVVEGLSLRMVVRGTVPGTSG